jgi:hypothetical protein
MKMGTAVVTREELVSASRGIGYCCREPWAAVSRQGQGRPHEPDPRSPSRSRTIHANPDRPALLDGRRDPHFRSRRTQRAAGHPSAGSSAAVRRLPPAIAIEKVFVADTRRWRRGSSAGHAAEVAALRRARPPFRADAVVDAGPVEVRRSRASRPAAGQRIVAFAERPPRRGPRRRSSAAPSCLRPTPHTSSKASRPGPIPAALRAPDASPRGRSSAEADAFSPCRSVRSSAPPGRCAQQKCWGEERFAHPLAD